MCVCVCASSLLCHFEGFDFSQYGRSEAAAAEILSCLAKTTTSNMFPLIQTVLIGA